MKNFLITGCGRSGTGFMSNLLNSNELKCGHEIQCGIHNFNNINLTHSESSWLLTPNINKFTDVNIIRLYRNPLKVIKSFTDLEFFNNSTPYYLFMKKYIPVDIINKSEIENASIYYIYWNLLFDTKIKDREFISLDIDNITIQENIILYNKDFNIKHNIINRKKNQKKKD